MKKIIFSLLIFLFFVNGAHATLDAEINVKDSFGINEQLSFEYVFSSNIQQELVFVPYIDCPYIPRPFLQKINLSLNANVPFEGLYSDLEIDPSIESQTCIAYLNILEPFEKSIKKIFYIKTNPTFSFDLNFCNDLYCKEISKVFIKNSKIYMNYDSDVQNLSISTSLIFPDKTIKQINIPSSIQLKQIGTYILDLTISKEGYKTITRREKFAVIEDYVDIPYDKKCNSNNICEKDENYQNCPQDCVFDNVKKNKFLFYFLIAILILIILFIVILFFILKNNNPFS